MKCQNLKSNEKNQLHQGPADSRHGLFFSDNFNRNNKLKPTKMKEEKATEVLDRLWGVKETYERYEVLNAMIEYAVMKLEIAHEKNMEIIKEVMKCKQ
jgi:hypothetical protein